MIPIPEHNRPENTKLSSLLDAGSNLLGDTTGAAVGAGIGFILGGPVGVIAGGAGGAIASAALKWVGREFSSRHLSKREEARAGGVLVFAAVEIHRRVENGESIRQDRFFDQGQSGRSGAEEVVENIVMKCQREPQEKKIPFAGYLLANLVFRSDISVDMAHQIIRLADDLTYRQLCLLRIAGKPGAFNLRDSDYRGQETFSNSLYPILHECLDLYHKGLLGFGGEVLFGPTDVWPSRMAAQGLGADIHNLMQLWLIPRKEMEPIVLQLK